MSLNNIHTVLVLPYSISGSPYQGYIYPARLYRQKVRGQTPQAERGGNLEGGAGGKQGSGRGISGW